MQRTRIQDYTKANELGEEAQKETTCIKGMFNSNMVNLPVIPHEKYLAFFGGLLYRHLEVC